MGITGIGNQNYYAGYQRTTGVKSHNSQTANASNCTSGNFVLRMTNQETGDKALTCVAFPGGGSASVFKAENYDEADPEYLVKYWDEKGEAQEYSIKPKEVNPSNASYLEMLAYTTYSDAQGYTRNAYGNFLTAARGVNGDISYDSSNVNLAKNFKSMIKEFMQMQYDANNLSGYLSYKQLYDYMESSVEDKSGK